MTMNNDASTFDIARYRWWTMAATEAEARRLIADRRRMNIAQGLPADRGLNVIEAHHPKPRIA